MSNLFYGWFDDTAQTEPTYEPSPFAPCPLCGRMIEAETDMRTFSIMPVEGYARRSYFYRTHRTCAEKHGPDKVDDFIFGLIERNGD